MEFINILTFQKYLNSKTLAGVAPLELLGEQVPMMNFFVKNRIADEVVKLEDEVTRLEKELKEERAKPSKPPKGYTGKVHLTRSMIDRLPEFEIEKLANQLGAGFDKNLNKKDNAASLAAMFEK